MSFLGGAECSTAGNPLSQFTKHVQDDRSLQHDRLVWRGGQHDSMRSQMHRGSQDPVSFPKRRYEETPNVLTHSVRCWIISCNKMALCMPRLHNHLLWSRCGERCSGCRHANHGRLLQDGSQISIRATERLWTQLYDRERSRPGLALPSSNISKNLRG